MNNAKIVGITKPLISVNGNTIRTGMTNAIPMNVDEFVAYVARVSNPSNQNNTGTAPKLLRYLAKHKHWSPFEMVNIVMEIETTRDIARQILRHRSFSFQEFSQRYADPTQDLGFELREARLQDTKNRQNSVEISPAESESAANLISDWEWIQEALTVKVKEAYNWAIENGIAKEQARAVLPEGLTVSRMYMNGTLRSWIHYCELRMANGTQKEHQLVAKSAWEQIVKEFPSLEQILENN